MPLEVRAADARVALTGLGVLLQQPREQSWANLSVTDLRRADCDGLWLHDVNLDRSCMEAAGLYHANLTQASLVSVNLRHADLKTAVLRRGLRRPGCLCSPRTRSTSSVPTDSSMSCR